MEKYYYFDNSATTKIDEKVLEKMLPYLKEEYGNASSLYLIGRNARKAIDESRIEVSKAINCDINEVYFTSGGTESDNTIISGIARKYKNQNKNIITSKIEHPAILNSCKEAEKNGIEIRYVDVDNDGLVRLETLKELIDENTVLISIMFANNEIGTIEPIKEIGEIAKEKGIIFHTDAVQAVGNIKIDVKELNIDSLSLSGHKIYGPKGIGVLYLRKGLDIEKFIYGGHQEMDYRAGTENVPGIVGVGEAIKLANENLEERISHEKNLRDYFLDKLKSRLDGYKINGSMENRLPGNINISIEGINSDILLMNLDMKNIYISSGSACASGSIEPSHVLQAINVDEKYLNSTIRISIGKNNTIEEIDYLLDNLVEVVNRIRK